MDLIRSKSQRYEDPARGGATVLVAQRRDVFIDQPFGIPAQPRDMPRTTLRSSTWERSGGRLPRYAPQMPAPVARGRGTPGGAATGTAGASRGRGGPPPSPLQGCVPYATADGKRAAFVRVPEHGVTIIILTNDASADARGMAQQLLDQVLARATRH